MWGERNARSFKKVERAALVMPRTCAAAVTDNPSATMILAGMARVFHLDVPLVDHITGLPKDA